MPTTQTERPTPTDPVRLIMSRTLATVQPEDDLVTVAQELTASEVGAVFVETPGEPLGLISERDLVTVIGINGDLERFAEQQASDIMTTDVVTTTAGTSIIEVGQLMREASVRHVPVTEGGRIVGVVSIRDVLNVLLGDD